MSRIPKELVDQIVQTADITEVVGDFVSLKRKGQNLWACCPFHNEKSPSFSVAPNKQLFKCFGCGKGGGVVDFVMEIETASYPEALRWLARRYNIAIPDDEKPVSDEEQRRQNERDSLLILTDWAKNYFKEKLRETDEGKGIGLAYLRERGLTNPTIDAFELGYSLDQWEALLQAATKQGFDLKYLEQTGLVVQREDADATSGRGRYDRFRGRVMFPIHNASGRVVGFGARTLRRDEKAGAKYLNSPESTIYHKSDVLYGLYQARQAVRQEDLCYLVEGYLDVISLWQGGVKNVVASSGTSLTEGQIRLISRYTKNVTVLYDGDAAGLRAALRGTDLLLEQGLNVRICTFPAGEDPDSFIQKQGDTAFRAYLTQHTRDFITFKAQTWQQQAAGDPMKRAEAIRDVLQSVARVPDAIKRSVFIQECARVFGLAEEVLLVEYNKIARTTRPLAGGGQQGGGQQPPSAPPAAASPGQSAGRGQASGPTDYPDDLPPEAYGADPDEVDLLTPDEPDHVRFEREVLRLLLNYPEAPLPGPDDHPWALASYVLTALAENGTSFRDPTCAAIAEVFHDALGRQTLPEPATFTQHFDEDVRKLAVDLFADRYALSEGWEKHHIYVPRELEVLHAAAESAILRLSRCAVQDRMAELTADLARAAEADEQNFILLELIRLKQVDQEIGKLLGIVIG